MEQRVGRLTRAAGRHTVPPPPDPTLGIWMVSMGFRLRPLPSRLHLSVRTPHRVIHSLGTLSQDRSPRSGSKCPVDRPSSSDQSERSATKRSTGHRSHRSLGTGNTGHRSPGAPVRQVTPVRPGAPVISVKPGAPVTPGIQGAQVTPVNTGQKALEVQDTQLLDRSELIVLNSPVRPVQLKHNVHESFDLLNSDSSDYRAHESPEQSILRHSGHRAPVIPAPVILAIPVTPAPVTPALVILAPVTPVTGQIVSIQSANHSRLGLML